MELSEKAKKIKLDDNARFVLRRQSVTLADVPDAGDKVNLRFNSNLSSGGMLEFVTDEVHPDNVRLAEKAAGTFGIDVAGIDFITSDITRSYRDIGGVIIEANYNIDFSIGDRDNYIEDLIFDACFPYPTRGRVPIIAVLEPSSDTFSADLRPMLERNCAATAFSETDGVWVNKSQIADAGLKLPRRTSLALSDFATERALLSVSADDLIASGLGVDRITVAMASTPAPIGRVPCFGTHCR